ncbi:Holliday junction branch migration protein RuvA [Ligilactobacillus equi]|uniref:Holliday junction branch migration protein RuvA n=1 Tax=Ligilactobacillus equi TaxID=137357 RepID=UPI002ED2C9C9
MYEYITGKITMVSPLYIVCENNGIGYQIFTANPFSFPEGEERRVYVYQAVRENDITLYGFRTAAEKQLFLKLISVSGIGPKSALAILASDDHQGLITAINADDDGYLVKYPGIGKKTAKQIVLDLKGKLDDLVGQNQVLPGQQSLSLENNAEDPKLSEAMEALQALGYRATEIKKIQKKMAGFKAEETSAYLRQALKIVNQK